MGRVMLNTLPAKKRTRRQTSTFRLGPRVPTDAVNLAFVQSIALNIQENLQVAQLSNLIPDNLTSPEATIRQGTYPDTDNITINGYTIYGRDAAEDISFSGNISMTDRVFVDDSVVEWDGDSTAVLARYRAYTAWFHVESIGLDSELLWEHASPFPRYGVAQWMRYRGKRIAVTLPDGGEFPYQYAIYVRRADMEGVPIPDLLNVWKVLVYFEDIPKDNLVLLRYDKAEARGRNITTMVHHEQGYSEYAVPLSVIPEDPVHQTARSWTKTAGAYPVIQFNNVGEYIKVLVDDIARVFVDVPSTANNHLPWFVRIKKGGFSWETDGATMTDPNGRAISQRMQIAIREKALTQFSLTYGYMPEIDNDLTVRFHYSTREFAEVRQGHAYSQAWSLASGESAFIDEDVIVTSHNSVQMSMPIVILIRETFTKEDEIREQFWIVSNLSDKSKAIEFLKQYTNQAAAVDGTNVGNISSSPAKFMRIITVDKNRIVFDNNIVIGAQENKKWFLPSSSVRAYYFYRNDFVTFDGYREDEEFFKCDLNPSVGHSFAGNIRKELTYNRNTKLWESGLQYIAPGTVELYDLSNNERIIPLYWDLGDTDFERGVFDLAVWWDAGAEPDRVMQEQRVLLVCKSMAIPGYNLFTTPVFISMLPYILEVEHNGNKTQIEVYTETEKIFFQTKAFFGNYESSAGEVVPLGRVDVVPNTIYGQNVVLDTRSRGGGLKENREPEGGERHFWDIGHYDGKPYTGNMVVVIEVPKTVRRRYLEAGLAEDQIEEMFKFKASKHIAKGSLILIQYV